MNPDRAIALMSSRRCRRFGFVVRDDLPKECPMRVKDTMRALCAAKDTAYAGIARCDGDPQAARRLKDVQACEECLVHLGELTQPKAKGRWRR